MTLHCQLQAQPSAFTYQGRLQTDGADAGGDYDFQCDLFASAGGGAALTSQTVTGVPVKGGLFALSLDYGAAVWPGADRWLELRVRPAGIGAYTTLTPRQRIASAPYSVQALRAGTASAVGAGSVTTAGLANGAVTTLKISDGTIAPADLSPALLTGTFWRLDGNGGSVPSLNFLGTTIDDNRHRLVAGPAGVVSQRRNAFLQHGAGNRWQQVLSTSPCRSLTPFKP